VEVSSQEFSVPALSVLVPVVEDAVYDERGALSVGASS